MFQYYFNKHAIKHGADIRHVVGYMEVHYLIAVKAKLKAILGIKNISEIDTNNEVLSSILEKTKFGMQDVFNEYIKNNRYDSTFSTIV